MAVRGVGSMASSEVVGSVGVGVELEWLPEEVMGLMREGWREVYVVDEAGFVVAATTDDTDNGSMVRIIVLYPYWLK